MTDRTKPPCVFLPDPERAKVLRKALIEVIEELRRRRGYPPAPPQWMQ